jgi:hypothetical protein
MIDIDIIEYYSPDVEINDPEVEANPAVVFLLELGLVPRGHETLDLFSIVVATPEGLRAHATRYPSQDILISGRGLVMSNFSWTLLRREIDNIVNKCRADSWDDIVLKLQRYFQWEYEDYIMEGDD